MTFSLPETASDPRYTSGGIYVPGKGGVTKWFSGDVYSVKLAAEQTGGALGVIEASVPPGGGPVAHTHRDQDETFYLFTEGGDEPQPGVQVPTWGPERFEGQMLDLFEKYALEALPEEG